MLKPLDVVDLTLDLARIDVEADAIAVTRAEQVSRSGRARDFRAQRQKLKSQKK